MTGIPTRTFDPTMGRPSWAPDGSRFLVENAWSTYEVDREGSRAARIGPQDAFVTGAAYSPDGQHVAYSVYSTPEGQALPEWRLFVADAQGDNPQQVSTDLGWHPTWSPDSKMIAFTKATDAGQYQQAVVNIDGTNQHEISHGGFDGHPSWTPDSQHVVFDSLYGGSRLYKVSADGTDQHQLRPVGDYGDELGAEISPDGASVLFEHRYPNSVDSDLALMPLEGFQAPLRLTNNGGASSTDPVWSPDGKHIAYSSNKGGTYDLYMIDADGGNEVRLTQGETHEFAPSWSPDGTKIAYITRDTLFHDSYGVVDVPGQAPKQA